MNTNSATGTMTDRGVQSAMRGLAWLALCIGSTLPLLAAAADTNYYVGTNDDVVNATTNCTAIGNATCSLREAVNAINLVGAGTHNVYLPADMITITGASGESNNASGDYDLKSATVQTINFIGQGSASTFINGNNVDRIFETIQTTVSLTFSNLTLQNGNTTGDGGCVRLAGASLSLTNTVVTGCRIAVGGVSTGRGGGIYTNQAGATITITNSTFSNNIAANTGGAVYSSGSVSINSTAGTMVFSGNNAGSNGGAIFATTSVISGGGGNFSFTSNSSTNGLGGAIYTGSGFNITNAVFGGSVATANHADGAAGSGGAIYANGGTGIVSSLKSSSVTYNTAPKGGGIYTQSNGTLNIDDSTISNNTSTSSGGGIYAGILRISNTIGTTYIENNTSGNAGAGVYVNISTDTTEITGAVIKNNIGPDVDAVILNPRGGGFSTNGAATITDSQITDNKIGGDGGGVAAVGVLTIIRSAIERNQSTGKTGGGVYGSGAVNITDSTIDGNISKGNGGGIAPSGTATLTRTTISNNTSQTGGGGGLYTPGGTANLYNSTVSGNQSVTTGGGIYTKFCSIINSTITLNSASNAGTTGGFYASTSPCTYENSIISSNTGAGGAAANCGGIKTSRGYNIESANTCGFAGTGDLPNTDPLLGALSNYGGPTKTHALQIGSPAIDKANNVTCAAAPIDNVDQRGEGRPLDGDAIPGAVCDIGAYEGFVVRPDHIKITHDGKALTCRAETVTITACANSACTVLYTDGANVTLTPGGLVFTIDATGINSAATVQQLTTGTVTLDAASAPAASGSPPTKCWNTITQTASCDMVFSDSGFVVTVPNHASCNDAATTIEALQGCVPVYQSEIHAVNLYSTYVNPTAGTQGITASTGAVSTASPGTQHALSFDATGKASITLSYPDAGQIMLTASDATLTGSGTFVVAPASFVFSGIPVAPLTAGQAFNATVTAMNACATPAATPNFNGTVSITSSNPQPGIGNATAINTSLSSFSGGAASTNLTWNEVGTIDLNASLNSYIGWTLPAAVTGLQAGVGRFRPAYFDTAVTPGCGTSFTYAGSVAPAKTGQPFTVTVKAKRFGGDATNATNTANYQGGYAYLTTLSNAGVATGLAGNTIAAAGFASGVGSANNVTYQAATPQTAELTLTMRATDADPSSPAVSSDGHTEGSALIRSGRVKLSNAHGSELLKLPIPIALQYYTANGWVPNTADTCSAIVASNFAFSSPGRNLAACETAMTVAGSAPNYTPNLAAPGNGNDGWTDLTLNLGAVPAGSTCTVQNAGTGFTGLATSANLPWLQFPWSGGAVNPSARATFGKYKGANEFIYMRENY